jgi:D-alanyl-lipoteichoic acid acyltransferase DltB (MBOAT superfamily)
VQQETALKRTEAAKLNDLQQGARDPKLLWGCQAMLFNSYEFIFLFLPIALGGFWFLSRFQWRSLVTGWLMLMSLIFYAAWSPTFLLLLLGSVTLNWLLGKAMGYVRKDIPPSEPMPAAVKLLLGTSIGFNLVLLGYFKYANFFIDTVNGLGGSLETIEGLVLPLGISFFTFQQISHLIGVAKARDHLYSFPRYLLFVIFFPQLIAGPIMTAEELIPQFRKRNYRFDARNLSLGFTIFAIGLFKKTVIADSVSGYASPIFTAADNGDPISFFLAWQAAIAYTLQLYFDFSAYSDMAVGLGQMFNIKVVMNFFSPYKAISVGDFWRRWHISLSCFLRDYLYIPLGGSRVGELRRYVNLLVTMLLGGLWHGANWTFVAWGGIQGLYLCIDHGWRQFLKRRGWQLTAWPHQLAAWSLTFLATVVAWVVFRAETLTGGLRILRGMFGGSGFILPESFAGSLGFLSRLGIVFGSIENYGGIKGAAGLMLVLGLALLLPNVYQFMARERVVLDLYHHLAHAKPAWWAWQPTLVYALLTALFFTVGLSFANRMSEFLYFQF